MSDPQISDPQCSTIRKAGINLKAKKFGGIIREAVLLERLALLERAALLERIQYLALIV